MMCILNYITTILKCIRLSFDIKIVNHAHISILHIINTKLFKKNSYIIVAVPITISSRVDEPL